MTVTMLTQPYIDVPRDRWGRPQIDGRSYTRASTLAKALDDTSNLTKWASRMTAVGLAKADDLVAAVATTSPDNKRELDALVKQAQERAGSTASRSIGTATHTATEMADRGESLDGLPAGIRRDADAYRARMAATGLVPLAAEMFVVCDEVNAAGSFDRLLAGPSRTLIGDIKTSASPDTAKWSALAWSIQLATYAHAKPWTPDRGIVEWADLGLPAPDQERGLVMHIVQGTGQVRLYSIDLVAGWQAARLADEVIAMRKLKNITTEIPA